MAPSAVPVTTPNTTNTKADGTSLPRFTIDDVLPHRAASAPMSKLVAPFASASLFQSKVNSAKPKAKRWDHLITEESKKRQPSSLKGAMKYFHKDVISLCGGLPSSDYFPFHDISLKLPVPPNFSESDTAVTGQTLTAGKHDIAEDKSLYDLSVALNYGQSMGCPQLIRFISEHTEIVHNPPYSDWEICLTTGSTSALEIALRLFCNPGDYVITEEYSFSSAMESIRPIGLSLLGIKMDERGMLPSDLDHVLSNWDPAARGGARKPFLVYTVPSGHNPTASTQDLERRKAIYQVAEKHNLYILEDEPYYFLQMDPFVSGVTHQVPHPFKPTSVSHFINNLVPSYLSLDTSGRVLRLDSFSKIIAPGSRCGWVTGSAQIVERFIRHMEVSAQKPSGFAEIALYKLLEENWGHTGFIEWLMFMRSEYTRRRDIMCNASEAYLPAEVASWVPPMAGMFHWISVDLQKHPDYIRASKSGKSLTHEEFLAIEEKVFLAAVSKNVLLARGSWFRAELGTDEKLFVRGTFAAASAENIEEGVRRLGEALRQEFGLPPLVSSSTAAAAAATTTTAAQLQANGDD